MVTSSFFTDSQAQFDATQKEFAKLWEDYQKQLTESQQEVLNTWLKSIPDTNVSMNFSDSVDKALNFQQALIGSALETQQAALRMTVEAQKQFWNSYFQLVKKTVQQVPTAS
ncbi:hypothetical protein [Egbenema bharatensis]|uniref:hypothetical protein n=1 Tax=Egbenema bharatensis TaxID=3463334 RepID=UPI003A84D18D